MDSRDKPTSDHEDDVHLEASKPTPEILDYVPDTEEERKLVRKIDLFLLPAIWGMYLLSYMVRTMLVYLYLGPSSPKFDIKQPQADMEQIHSSMGNAEIAGMEDDLNLNSSKYSVALVVFFVGYVVCGVPSK